MSASLNADLLSRYFDSAPLIHVNGRTFPVKKHFLPEIQQLVKSSSSIKSTDVTRPFVDQEMIIKLIRHIDLNKPSEGAILCFLPGWADIKSLHSKLKVFPESHACKMKRRHINSNRNIIRAKRHIGSFRSIPDYHKRSKNGSLTGLHRAFAKSSCPPTLPRRASL